MGGREEGCGGECGGDRERPSSAGEMFVGGDEITWSRSCELESNEKKEDDDHYKEEKKEEKKEKKEKRKKDLLDNS